MSVLHFYCRLPGPHHMRWLPCRSRGWPSAWWRRTGSPSCKEVVGGNPAWSINACRWSNVLYVEHVFFPFGSLDQIQQCTKPSNVGGTSARVVLFQHIAFLEVDSKATSDRYVKLTHAPVNVHAFVNRPACSCDLELKILQYLCCWLNSILKNCISIGLGMLCDPRRPFKCKSSLHGQVVTPMRHSIHSYIFPWHSRLQRLSLAAMFCIMSSQDAGSLSFVTELTALQCWLPGRLGRVANDQLQALQDQAQKGGTHFFCPAPDAFCRPYEVGRSVIIFTFVCRPPTLS